MVEAAVLHQDGYNGRRISFPGSCDKTQLARQIRATYLTVGIGFHVNYQQYLLTYVKWNGKLFCNGLIVALGNVALSQQLEFYLVFLQLLTGGAARVKILDPCSLVLL